MQAPDLSKFQEQMISLSRPQLTITKPSFQFSGNPIAPQPPMFNFSATLNYEAANPVATLPQLVPESQLMCPQLTIPSLTAPQLSTRNNGASDGQPQYQFKTTAALNHAANGGSLLFQNKMNCVFTEPNGGGQLFVGSIGAAKDLELLDENRVTLIVNCQESHTRNEFEDKMVTTESGAEMPRFEYLRCDMNHLLEQPNFQLQVIESLHPIFREVDAKLKAGHNVLIHCMFGAHRSGSVAIAFLMWRLNTTWHNAWQIIVAQRPCVNPTTNEHYKDKLMFMLQKLQSQLLQQQ